MILCLFYSLILSGTGLAQGTQAKGELVSTANPGRKAGTKRSFDMPHGRKINMVWIPPGRFIMGSTEREPHRDVDEPSHEVHITRGFWMSETEVTQDQWEALISNPSFFKGGGRVFPGKVLRKNFPVEQVNWFDAVKFIASLNKSEGKDVYRLPTEAEWEYACRAGSAQAYAGAIEEMAWFIDNAEHTTHPVATKKPNAWGLYDMHGNVWEWCQDWDGDYDQSVIEDPTGPEDGLFKIKRGGSWNYDAWVCRSANRDRFQPKHHFYALGFRLVRIAED